MGLVRKSNFMKDLLSLSPDQIRLFGKTLFIAPHQDDETLGCGGTIHLLQKWGIPVHVLFVSDGSMSHPNSIKYPKEKLVELREQESVDALAILGISREQISFLRMKDSELPHAGSADFESAVGIFTRIFNQLQPETIFVPWERDPHQDHRATWQITDQAITGLGFPIRRLEYFIWLWERADDADLPTSEDGKMWQVAVGSAMEYKKRAIAAYPSQTTSLIDDDPEGFTLSPEVLAHFHSDVEIFLERTHETKMSDQKQTLPEGYFNDVYRNNDDPWNFEGSEYEREKYAVTLEALSRERFQNAFEIGCSIGVLTQMLAHRCNKLLSVDAAEAPVVTARKRLSDFEQVQISKMGVPREFPDQEFDLIVLSEVGYYFSMPDLIELRSKILGHLQTGGQLLLVHWTPEVHDYPLTGDQVHDTFSAVSGNAKPLRLLHSLRRQTYRLDSFEKLPDNQPE